jgi:class 3 adenylate cyclase/tetratricopeptide (TPR) repeat protein
MSTLVTRRLAAIVIADVVGYTRLMERDDTGTYARVRLIRDEVVDPAIVSHGGRVVKSAGDGLLAEFSSALAALRASIQIQRQMASLNVAATADERIEHRIGVNLGDIMVDDADIAGDGVNVASRLEAMAEPGGICVSSAVRDQVHGQLDIEFIDRGEHQLKNIARPLRVFAVQVDAPSSAGPASTVLQRDSVGNVPNSAQMRRQARIRRFAWTALSVTLIAALLIAVAWNARAPLVPDAPAMSVGVRSLVAAPGDAPSAQRAAALTRDLTSQLALADVAIRAVPVTAAHDKGGQGDTASLAQATNVRYMLEGDAQFAQDETTIRLRLLDGATNEQIWSEIVSLSEATVPQQVTVLRRAMEHLRGRLFTAEAQRGATSKGNTAMDYVLRAYALDSHGDLSLDQLRRSEALYEEALRRDPDLVPALLGVRGALDGQLDVASSAERERIIRRMDEVTSRAVNLNRAAPDTWAERSAALMLMGRWDAALEASSRAVQLDPGAAWLVARRAWSMSMIGRPDEALKLVEQAIAMDPPGSWWTIRVGCEAHVLAGQYDRAIAQCEKAAGQTGSDFDIAYFLAAAYGHAGLADKAADERAKILKRSPGFTIAELRAKRYSVHPDYVRLAELHWYSGLRKAGIPDH